MKEPKVLRAEKLSGISGTSLGFASDVPGWGTENVPFS